MRLWSWKQDIHDPPKACWKNVGLRDVLYGCRDLKKYQHPIPHTATVSDTSTIPQHDIRTSLDPHAFRFAWVGRNFQFLLHGAVHLSP